MLLSSCIRGVGSVPAEVMELVNPGSSLLQFSSRLSKSIFFFPQERNKSF
jgi:hypothetical protein